MNKPKINIYLYIMRLKCQKACMDIEEQRLLVLEKTTKLL